MRNQNGRSVLVLLDGSQRIVRVNFGCFGCFSWFGVPFHLVKGLGISCLSLPRFLGFQLAGQMTSLIIGVLFGCLGLEQIASALDNLPGPSMFNQKNTYAASRLLYELVGSLELSFLVEAGGIVQCRGVNSNQASGVDLFVVKPPNHMFGSLACLLYSPKRRWRHDLSNLV